jgi:integrase
LGTPAWPHQAAGDGDVRRREALLYELAKILGHSNIKMTERYAKLGRQHIARTGNTAREIWKLLEKEEVVQAHTG